jgi:hypothetical protein
MTNFAPGYGPKRRPMTHDEFRERYAPWFSSPLILPPEAFDEPAERPVDFDARESLLSPPREEPKEIWQPGCTPKIWLPGDDASDAPPDRPSGT